MAKIYDPIMCMMVDKPDKAQDESYVVRGRKYKVVKRDGDNVTVIGPDGKVTKMHIDFLMSEGVKTKDKLVKVPDNKLKDFEANLRSAGFKVVSKSDRGMSTHYQVEVNSSKKFSDKAELREWAEKIDAVCDKMDSVAPTTWNIGLTSDGKITAGLDVREMYVKDSASALDKAIKTCDAASGDAMKQIASTAKSWTKQYNQLFEKATTEEEVNKLKSQKDNDYRRALDNLDKIYNEVSQAYGHARNEVESLFDEVDSNAFKAYRRVTQK